MNNINDILETSINTVPIKAWIEPCGTAFLRFGGKGHNQRWFFSSSDLDEIIAFLQLVKKELKERTND